MSAGEAGGFTHSASCRKGEASSTVPGAAQSKRHPPSPTSPWTVLSITGAGPGKTGSHPGSDACRTIWKAVCHAVKCPQWCWCHWLKIIGFGGQVTWSRWTCRAGGKQLQLALREGAFLGHLLLVVKAIAYEANTTTRSSLIWHESQLTIKCCGGLLATARGREKKAGIWGKINSRRLFQRVQQSSSDCVN